MNNSTETTHTCFKFDICIPLVLLQMSICVKMIDKGLEGAFDCACSVFGQCTAILGIVLQIHIRTG
jgi:hypothetical protein